jgi:hypothetical protein
VTARKCSLPSTVIDVALVGGALLAGDGFAAARVSGLGAGSER